MSVQTLALSRRKTKITFLRTTVTLVFLRDRAGNLLFQRTQDAPRHSSSKLSSALGFHCFSSVMFSVVKQQVLMTGLVLRARYQAQSHDISTMLEEQKHHQRGFSGFCFFHPRQKGFSGFCQFHYLIDRFLYLLSLSLT